MLSNGQYIEKHQDHTGHQTGRKSLANHQAPFTEGPTRPFSERFPDKIATGFQLLQVRLNMTYDVGYLTCDMWYLIWNVGSIGYMMISVYLVLLFGYYSTHALKYPIPVSARTLASMPHALGDGESLTFAESMGGLTTNPIFACKDLVNQIVVFDSKNI